MLINTLTKAVRTYYAGCKSEFIFKKQSVPEFRYGDIDTIHLYVHVPFCKHCCPYCPYNKMPVDTNLVELFFKALDTEIELYYNSVGNINISSIYFGGGSPALFPEKIALVIEHISKRFRVIGEICIEINPNDCSIEKLQILKLSGVKTVSIGVQSFQDANLSFIGRSYNSIIAEKAVEAVCNMFDSVNIDLMFALPSQNNESILFDLSKAISYGVSQITTYPLFTFPYSTIGNYKKIKKVKMPDLNKRKTQYYSIYDLLTEKDYKQVSVWSFKKGDGSKFSSVTRDGYIGLGAGAGTHLPNGYYLNTFPVKAYISKLENHEFPTALKFAMNKQLNDLFWLYWRFYDTKIPISEFNERFENIGKVKRLFSFLQIIGMLSKTESEFVLTRKGSFWLHLAQNYFSLRYINLIWAQSMQDDFPNEIRF
jgi:oxygen-independent coproporphyrinogen-3 oxidase